MSSGAQVPLSTADSRDNTIINRDPGETALTDNRLINFWEPDVAFSASLLSSGNKP